MGRYAQASRRGGGPAKLPTKATIVRVTWVDATHLQLLFDRVVDILSSDQLTDTTAGRTSISAAGGATVWVFAMDGATAISDAWAAPTVLTTPLLKSAQTGVILA